MRINLGKEYSDNIMFDCIIFTLKYCIKNHNGEQNHIINYIEENVEKQVWNVLSNNISEHMVNYIDSTMIRFNFY